MGSYSAIEIEDVFTNQTMDLTKNTIGNKLQQKLRFKNMHLSRGPYKTDQRFTQVSLEGYGNTNKSSKSFQKNKSRGVSEDYDYDEEIEELKWSHEFLR